LKKLPCLWGGGFVVKKTTKLKKTKWKNKSKSLEKKTPVPKKRKLVNWGFSAHIPTLAQGELTVAFIFFDRG